MKKMKVTLREPQSLIDLLNFACSIQLYRVDHFETSDLTFGIKRPRHLIRLSREINIDLWGTIYFSTIYFEPTHSLCPSALLTLLRFIAQCMTRGSLGQAPSTVYTYAIWFGFSNFFTLQRCCWGHRLDSRLLIALPLLRASQEINRLFPQGLKGLNKDQKMNPGSLHNF